MKLIYKMVIGLVLFSILITLYQIIFLGLNVKLFKNSSVRYTEITYTDLDYFESDMTREEAINYNLIAQMQSEEYKDYIRDYLAITGPEYFELILGIHYAESFSNSDYTPRNYFHPTREVYKAGDLMKDQTIDEAIAVNGRDFTWIGALGLNKDYLTTWGFKNEVEWTIDNLEETLSWVKDKEHLKIAQPISHNAGPNALYDVVLGGNSDISMFLGVQTSEDDFRNNLLEVLYNDITDMKDVDPTTLSAEKVTAHLIENHGWFIDPDACWAWSDTQDLEVNNAKQIDQGLDMDALSNYLTTNLNLRTVVKPLDTTNLKYNGKDIKDSVATKYGNMIYKDMGDGTYIVMNPQSLNHAAKTYYNGKYHYGLLLQNGEAPGVIATNYETFIHSRGDTGALASGVKLQSGVYTADISRKVSNNTNNFKERGYSNPNTTIVPGYGKIAFPLYVGEGSLVLTGEFGVTHDGIDFATRGLAAQLGITYKDVPVINSLQGVVTQVNEFPFNYDTDTGCIPEGFGSPAFSPVVAYSSAAVKAAINLFPEIYRKTISTGWAGYGYSVEIKTELMYQGEPVYIRYAHMDRILDYVNVGDTIATGSQIGFAGNTGHSTGPHLHYEMLIKVGAQKIRINPLDYLAVTKIN